MGEDVYAHPYEGDHCTGSRSCAVVACMEAGLGIHWDPFDEEADSNQVVAAPSCR